MSFLESIWTMNITIGMVISWHVAGFVMTFCAHWYRDAS